MANKPVDPQRARTPSEKPDGQPEGATDGANATAGFFGPRFVERNLPTLYRIFGPGAAGSANGAAARPKAGLKLLVADEHRVVAESLAALLRGDGYRNIGCSIDSEQLLEAFDAAPPDIAILDYWLPRLGGLEVLRRAKAREAPIRILLLGAGLNGAQALEAFRLGADGLLSKHDTGEDLRAGVAAVCAGEQWVGPLATQLLLQEVTGRSAAARGAGRSLTPRESEIVSGVVRGRRNKELARELVVTEGTVKMHLHNIYEKLGVKNRTELAVAARDSGLF